MTGYESTNDSKDPCFPSKTASCHIHTKMFLSFYLDYENTIDVSTDDG